MFNVMFWIVLCISVTIGFLIGILFASLRFAGGWQKKIVGTLRIDHSDSDGPYCFLELNERLEEVEKQDVVLLEIDARDYISHK